MKVHQSSIAGRPSSLLLPPIWLRLYLYGLHAFLIEVSFTAAWELLANHNWKLPGCSSVWCFFIYAACGYGMERAYWSYMRNRVAIGIRALVYLAWLYTCEFISGSVLRRFDACIWNYTEYTYFHVDGLIAFDYAPLWIVATLLTEKFLLEQLPRCQWTDP